MRILIVGETGSLAGELNQALADYGLDWDVRWPTVADALADVTPADALVCDARAGEAGGAALLAELRANHPDAVRILLLDDGMELDAFQALECAHRLLRKPLDASELIEAVESVVELRELLGSDELKQALGSVDSLPAPPSLYIDLVQLMRDPDASNADIAEVLSQDPALAAKVLRLCNSAYFSAGRVINDISGAVTRLGHSTIQRLVLATEAFGGASDIEGVDREALQDRALRTSRLAGRLLDGPSTDLAATAGLLAEIGTLLKGVRMTLPDGSVRNPDGPHPAQAGAYLLGLWGLPMPIVEAVANHHQPARVRMGGFWVTGAVHVAAALVAGTGVDEDYLRSVGQLDQLPKWRAAAEKLAETG